MDLTRVLIWDPCPVAHIVQNSIYMGTWIAISEREGHVYTRTPWSLWAARFQRVVSDLSTVHSATASSKMKSCMSSSRLMFAFTCDRSGIDG